MWGLKIPGQRLKKLAFLVEVRAVMALPEFPKKLGGKGAVKGKGYFLRSDIERFGATRLKISKDRKTFNIQHSTFNIEHRAAAGGRGDTPALQAQDKPADGELFEPDSAAFEKTLDLWEDKLKNPERWMESPLQSWQMKQLEKHRPWLFKSKTAGENDFGQSDEFMGGREAAAAYVQMKFPGVLCNKMDVSNWQRAKHLPSGCTEPFPPPHNSGRNSKLKIDAWVEKYLKSNASQQSLSGVENIDYERAQKKLDFERSQEEYALWQRSTSGKWIRFDLARSLIAAGDQQACGYFEKLIEDKPGTIGDEPGLVERAATVAQKFGVALERLPALRLELKAEFVAAVEKLKGTFDAMMSDLEIKMEELNQNEKKI